MHIMFGKCMESECFSFLTQLQYILCLQIHTYTCNLYVKLVEVISRIFKKYQI